MRKSQSQPANSHRSGGVNARSHTLSVGGDTSGRDTMKSTNTFNLDMGGITIHLTTPLSRTELFYALRRLLVVQRFTAADILRELQLIVDEGLDVQELADELVQLVDGLRHNVFDKHRRYAGEVAASEKKNSHPHDEILLLDEELLSTDRLCYVRVRGDSMIDAGIKPSDIILVRRQSTADDGEIVVALLKDKDKYLRTLKRFRHDMKDPHKIRLEPANPRYKPILTDDTNVEVIGVFVRVIPQLLGGGYDVD
jgi:hypothetical protein